MKQFDYKKITNNVNTIPSGIIWEILWNNICNHIKNTVLNWDRTRDLLPVLQIRVWNPWTNVADRFENFIGHTKFLSATRSFSI